MICYSPSGTTKLIDSLCEDHDVEVKVWGDQMKEALDVSAFTFVEATGITATSKATHYGFPNMSVTSSNYLQLYDDCELLQGLRTMDFEDSESDDESIVAPPFSPIGSEISEDSESQEEEEESDVEEEVVPQSATCESEDPLASAPNESSGSSVVTSSLPPDGDSSLAVMAHGDNASDWTGLKLVGDNVDKNYHASLQRIGLTTKSVHYFNLIALLDHVDFSGLSDKTPPPSVVDPMEFLPDEDDIALLRRDFKVLISR